MQSAKKTVARYPTSLLKKCIYAKTTVVFPCGLVL